ncbi:PREDICTED: uncharacterized protein LOC108572768 [Habropoda laboriosa]|uniref:uncharacterized protein LOC108572768 n=1 Tax=Habropoda laboriosa TaxID=597456 RepID=UPI00083E11E9|nr:PREDICTED: uncharacterized protein LOC108572768 [Habropoda laboriosa]
MRIACCWLLFLAVLCVRGSFQRANKRAIDTESKSDRTANNDALSRTGNEDATKKIANMKKLQELLKKATNSTTNTTTQVTAVRQGPCQCGGGICGCCSRILFDTWKQKACVNVTYEPEEFAFTAKISMNDRVLYTRTVSGKNPRPVCVPVPRIPIVKACVRFYNIYFQGRNMHMCVNMEGKFRDVTMFKVGLDCIRFGSNGLALVKPEDGGGIGQIEFLPGDDDDEDEDDYDYDDEDDEDDDLLDF